MNQKDLEQYEKIQKEIKLLENKIVRLSENKYKFGVDSVNTAATFPYSKHKITIIGYGYDSSNDSKKQKLIEKYKDRVDNLYKELNQMQTFIKSINDSEIRQIIELKYIERLSWNATAKNVYDYPCGDRARKKLERFLKKN